MGVTGLDHVQLAAPPGGEAQARRFFGELLGLAELERLAASLEAAGAPVRWDDELPGARRFYTADPFGNRLELLAVTERP
jgi:extradiol dioxygenase family protein